jgi:hypothetical protein
MSLINGVARWAAVACILMLILALSGCAGASLQQIAREDPSGAARYTQLEAGGGVVRVYRSGRPLDTRRGMQLQPGDEIETGASGAAVIRFPEGEVILAAGTRVRIGSLEVLFGRVFANVRGLFTASSENVVAGVEGTGFVFEVGRDRSVRVVVLDGVVACRSRTGSWPTVRLGPRQALTSPYPNRVQPRAEQASTQEVEEIVQWVQQVTGAPLPPPVIGWCCSGGRVTQTSQGRCAGEFSPNRADAERVCAPPTGWCCAGGRVTQTLQGRCAGEFYPNRADADRVCARPPEPTGWCCARGRVTQAIQGRCAGEFYPSRTDAERACAPPPQPMGWCCAGGNVTYGGRDACRGSFFTDQTSARRACATIR